MSEISYQIDLGAAPGRKSRQELNSEAENLPDHQKWLVEHIYHEVYAR